MQVLKKSGIKFIKSTKGVFDKLYKISEYHGSVNYYIYNGTLLEMDCFNIQYSLLHNKVSLTLLQEDEVYIINEIDNITNFSFFAGEIKINKSK